MKTNRSLDFLNTAQELLRFIRSKEDDKIIGVSLAAIDSRISAIKNYIKDKEKNGTSIRSKADR